MKTVSIRDAKNRLTELARMVEKGETIVVTRNGRPVLDLVPHRPQRGLDLKALAEFKKRNGLKRIVASTVAADLMRLLLDTNVILRVVNERTSDSPRRCERCSPTRIPNFT
jgi:prevent-host-death family protein